MTNSIEKEIEKLESNIDTGKFTGTSKHFMEGQVQILKRWLVHQTEMETKIKNFGKINKLCSCGMPQSFPVPHEHDRTEREEAMAKRIKELEEEITSLKHQLDMFSNADEEQMERIEVQGKRIKELEAKLKDVNEKYCRLKGMFNTKTEKGLNVSYALENIDGIINDIIKRKNKEIKRLETELGKALKDMAKLERKKEVKG